MRRSTQAHAVMPAAPTVLRREHHLSCAVAIAAGSFVAYGSAWLCADRRSVGATDPFAAMQPGARRAPSASAAGPELGSAFLTANFPPSALSCCTRSIARAAAVPTGSPVAAVYEWQIGVDSRDGRALYAAWVGWLRTQDRSSSNVHTLGIALSGVDGSVRAGVVAAALAAGDGSALSEALAAPGISDGDAADLGRQIAELDPSMRARALSAAAGASFSVFFRSLVDLQQGTDPSYLRDASEATVDCSVDMPCGLFRALYTLAPSVVDLGVARVAREASVCGMPKTKDDLRAVWNGVDSAPWCSPPL